MCRADFVEIQGSSSQILETLQSPPIAVIRGGDRLYGAFQNLALDATASWFPDLAPELQPSANLNFNWSCTIFFLNQTWMRCNGFGTGAGPELKILAGSLGVDLINVTDYIRIDLNVATNLSPSAQGEAYIKLYPYVNPTLDVMISSVKRRYSTNERVVLIAEVNLDSQVEVLYVWTTVNGDKDVRLAQNILSLDNKQRTLTLKPNVITPGTVYTFRVSVNALDAIGWGQLSISVNIPPSQGEFFVLPLSGFALETSFQLSYRGWQDAEQDLPILFQTEYFEPTKQVLDGLQSPQVM